MGWKFHLSCDLNWETEMMWRSPYTRASWLRWFILFKFLRGQITLEELQRQWGEASKQSSVDSRKQPAWTKLLLPCRTCSETASDKDFRWPARCFIEDISKDKLWKHILLGYDLLCYKCQRTKTNQRRTRFLMCEQCQDLCRRGAFSTETQRRWDAGETVMKQFGGVGSPVNSQWRILAHFGVLGWESLTRTRLSHKAGPALTLTHAYVIF